MNREQLCGSWDITGKGVPLAVVIGAVLLTTTALLSADRIIDGRIDAKLGPILSSVQVMQLQQNELLKTVQAMREDMARYQERAIIERTNAHDAAIRSR